MASFRRVLATSRFTRSCKSLIQIWCVMYGYTATMLNYTEDGAEASGSEYAAVGSSAFEDEAL